MKKVLLSLLVLMGLCLFFFKTASALEVPGVEISIPVHGSWCGPGHGTNTPYDPYPVDVLDYGCMRHDLCYAKNGYSDAGCDKDLLAFIENNKSYMTSSERAIANLVYATFYLSKFRN
ncbi:hypothetical protein MKL26_08045 [Streptococcus suis]|nr:hypothetical protein [Streptococcus suis]